MKPPEIALIGNPNSGKTALFNVLTQSRQKVGNYPGVTVERKEGLATLPGERTLRVLDLPGVYSLDARTPDEVVTQEVLLNRVTGENPPDAVVVVLDATSLQRSLALVLEVRDLGYPLVVALNMMDLAEQRGTLLDLEALERELGVPCIPTVAVRGDGVESLLEAVWRTVHPSDGAGKPELRLRWEKPSSDEIRSRFFRVDQMLGRVLRRPPAPVVWTDRLDRVLLHPVSGLVTLGLVLTLVFQAIFSWARWPMDWIDSGIQWVAAGIMDSVPSGPLRSLAVDGILAGAGTVLVFLPQILLLFLFILILEDSGYMARVAFLMDRVMGKVGLHGRAFIPLLSSYACAVPGIMATRTIENPRDRLTTILVIPLTTCSARLPVYSLLIGAFIPDRALGWGIGLRGLVMLGLYAAGIIASLLMALVLRKTILRGATPPLVLEMPTYKWPSLRNLVLGLREKGVVFVQKVGTVIVALSIVLWFLASYPEPQPGSVPPGTSPIAFSYAGRLGHALEPLVRPIGFNWQIAVALIPGFAAREIMIGALATVYALDTRHKDDHATAQLITRLSGQWSLATALSLLVWYVLSCQCFSTLAVTRRETNSWRWPAFMLFYMTALAWLGSFVTWRAALALGWG